MLPHACDPASESLTTVARYHQRICPNPSNDSVGSWAERHRQGKIRRECCYYERATRLFNRFALIRWWWRSFTTGGFGRRSECSGSVSHSVAVTVQNFWHQATTEALCLTRDTIAPARRELRRWRHGRLELRRRTRPVRYLACARVGLTEGGVLPVPTEASVALTLECTR